MLYYLDRLSDNATVSALPPSIVEAPKPAPSASKDRRETFIVIRLPPLFFMNCSMQPGQIHP